MRIVEASSNYRNLANKLYRMYVSERNPDPYTKDLVKELFKILVNNNFEYFNNMSLYDMKSYIRNMRVKAVDPEDYEDRYRGYDILIEDDDYGMYLIEL